MLFRRFLHPPPPPLVRVTHVTVCVVVVKDLLPSVNTTTLELECSDRRYGTEGETVEKTTTTLAH